MRDLIIAALLGMSGAAFAQEATVEQKPEQRGPTLEVALKGGVRLPQVYSPLNTTFDAVLKVGLAPWSFKRLQVFADFGYSLPQHKDGTTDPRLGEAGAEFDSNLTIHDVRTTVGVQFFITNPAGPFLAWAGAGFRAHFLTMDVKGGTTADFGRYTETVTRVGAAFNLGAGYRLGPGMILLESTFTYIPVEERTPGLSNIGAIGFQAGYALLF
jgi:hypothetical protein